MYRTQEEDKTFMMGFISWYENPISIQYVSGLPSDIANEMMEFIEFIFGYFFSYFQ